MFRCPVISWGGLLDGGIRLEPSQRRWHGHELGHGIGRDGHRVCLPKPAPLARIKRDAAGIKRRRSGAQRWRASIGWSTPTGRRCWHSIAFGRSAGGTKSAVPVFYPDSSGMTQVDKPRQGLERFTGRLIAVRPASVLRTWADAARPGGTAPGRDMFATDAARVAIPQVSVRGMRSVPARRAEMRPRELCAGGTVVRCDANHDETGDAHVRRENIP